MALDGVWWNELRSQMEIKMDAADPRGFTGYYHTNVGQAQARTYSLAGRCDAYGGADQTVGWVVAFDPPDEAEPGQPPNLPSLTAWSGQLHTIEIGGVKLEFIAATWILTRMTSPADDWRSTLVNRDYFFRLPPTEAQLESAQKYGKAARFFS